MTLPADYYAVLSLPPSCTQQQIRDAYKRLALKTHPDRVPTDSPERASRTKKFQLVNDAYYTLSDPGRRREYDATRAAHGYDARASGRPFDFDSDEVPEEDSSAGAQTGAGGSAPGFGFPFSAFGFGSGSGSGNGDARQQREQQQDAQFGDVFEEMLREEGMAEGEKATPTGKFWSVVGGLSGGAMGFIVANFPGMLAGAVAGNRLGAVRDAKGKSVYSVFQELPQNDKAALMAQLAAKVFSHAVGI